MLLTLVCSVCFVTEKKIRLNFYAIGLRRTL